MREVTTSSIPHNRLRDLRFAKQIGQWQLALLSGVKQSRISLIQNRLVKPTLKEKEKISAALNHTVKDVFPDSET